MFGSDPARGPHVIAFALDGITSADFLSAEQRRDIHCENAARFFRLDSGAGGR
jgi:predicted TIM-barrel fold metal-dependent hydrolase